MFQFCNKFSQMKLVKNQMCFFFYQKCVNVLQITMHCINYTNTLILMFDQYVHRNVMSLTKTMGLIKEKKRKEMKLNTVKY